MKYFLNDILELFSNNKLKECANKSPIELDSNISNIFLFENVNHYQIKDKDTDELFFGEELSEKSIEIVRQILNDIPNELKSEIKKRNIYITSQTKDIKKGNTSRVSGWHLDGMQGSEIKELNPGCFQVIAYNDLPTEFCIQDFNIEKFDRHKHNYFDSLGSQVKVDNIVTYPKNKLLLMNTYQLHKCLIAKEDIKDRKFLRIYFTYSDITSIKMTVNSNFKYSYKIHTTSGNIPDYLELV